MAEEQLQPEDHAKAVVDVLASDAQIDVVWSPPRRLLQLPSNSQ